MNSSDKLDTAIPEKDTCRRVWDIFPLPCVSVQPDGTIINCNKYFSDFFHVSKDAVERINVISYLSPDDRSLFHKFLGSVVQADPVPQQNDFEFAVPGSDKPLKTRVRAVVVNTINKGGTIVLAIESMTQRLDIEEEKKAARKQLYRSAHLASIGTLASGVAHEINNPLTAILGFSSALLVRINNNEEIDIKELGSYLQIIHNETIRCRDIIEYLHRFARENGESRIGRVSLLASVVNALKFVNIRALRFDITIINEIQEDLWVRADSVRLDQVFVNLLTNCIDFCGSGAIVTISPVADVNKTKYAVVTVRDNGPGMTAAVLANVFNPFFTTKEAGKGMGMGLAICYKVMEELNGRIDIASEVGNGTTVRLEIPRYSETVSGGNE
ncbi:MAG: HAMP domain-containing sensor histidine kinase [Chitinispirillaceae bacterium]